MEDVYVYADLISNGMNCIDENIVDVSAIKICWIEYFYLAKSSSEARKIYLNQRNVCCSIVHNNFIISMMKIERVYEIVCLYRYW